MVIDTLTSTNVYVEKQQPITVSRSINKNNNGILLEDDLGNSLVSNIDIGDSTFVLSYYNGFDGIIFHNVTTDKFQLAYAGDTINVGFDFTKGTRYYIGAKKITIKSQTKNKFKIITNGYRIFKIFLDNGLELKEYIIDNGYLSITGNDNIYIDDFSEITVYVIKEYNIKSENQLSISRDENNELTTLDFNISKYIVGSFKSLDVMRDEENSSTQLNYSSDILNNYDFKLTYMGYPTIYDKDRFFDSYFDTNGMELLCFERLSISNSIEKDSFRTFFRNSDKTTIRKIVNSCEIEVFNDSEFKDFTQFIKQDEFRFVLVNPSYGRVFILNNCRINNGMNIVFQKEKNTKSLNISSGNYIDISTNDNSVINSSYGG